MLLTTLLAAAALHGGPTPVLAQSNTTEQTAEDIEVFRRILVKALDETFESGTRKDNNGIRVHQGSGFQLDGFVTTLWTGEQTVQHSRVFHMPEVGLFLALDASLPTVKKEADAKPEKAGPAGGDEWERARREVRGDHLPGGLRTRMRLASPTPSEIDPAAIAQVTDIVLRTIALHVNRIEGLGSSGTVTIALRMSGSHRGWLEELATIDEEEPESEDEAGYFVPNSNRLSYMIAGGHDAPEQNLVIRVALSDLSGQPEGDLERLRQRALINRY